MRKPSLPKRPQEQSVCLIDAAGRLMRKPSRTPTQTWAFSSQNCEKMEVCESLLHSLTATLSHARWQASGPQG